MLNLIYCSNVSTGEERNLYSFCRYDGASINKPVIEKLGVTIGLLNSQCWFSQPLDAEKKVFCLFDAAHVLKLIRNKLSEKKVLLDGGGNVIKWGCFSNSEFPRKRRFACNK